MKLIKTQDAIGHVLCHDLTQIIPGKTKGPRFHKGHVVQEADIPVLLSMGKENLYIWEMTPGMIHENQGAERLADICQGDHMTRSQAKEGKIELTADCDGLLLVDSQRLLAINSLDELMIATRHGGVPVRKGDKLAGTRIIPLIISDEKLKAAEAIGGDRPLLQLLPYKLKTAAIVTTGSEVQKGLIQDAFTPIVKEKLAAYGIETISQTCPGDKMEDVVSAIQQQKATGADLILCTGGMSVDPDDNTPGAIKRTGASIVTYGAPVLPGAMFLLGYYDDGTPVLGLPGCVMYAKTTIFDLVLPKIAAGVPVTKGEIAAMGEGGLCLGCETCRWPDCSFGK